MTLRRWTLSASEHKTWQRLLALSMVLVLALATLSAHAATDSCRDDCIQLQGKMLDQGQTLDIQADCGTACALPLASAQPAVIPPLARPFMATTAVSDHIPQPPCRPPRT